MKQFKLTASKTLELTESSLSPLAQNELKVKINKTLITNGDIHRFDSFSGEAIVPLSSAVAVISETNESTSLERGERIYVNPYITCDNCYHCKNDKPKYCSSLKKYGKNADGMLTEFKIIPCKNAISLPDSVDDISALFIDNIALAINILDSVQIDKGEHILIYGNCALSNILCQLTLYYQAVPILISKNKKNIDIAKKMGVYYIIEDYENLENKIKALTGGRMAENAVYLTSSSASGKYIADCCCAGANIVFCGANNKKFIDYQSAYKKLVNIKFVSNGFGNIFSAINILANKAVNTSEFVSMTINFADSAEAFSKISQNIGNDDTFDISVIQI